MAQSTANTSRSLSLAQRVWQSFQSSLGSIVFGMEDGTVSIFGLVFGVAASASTSQAGLLAGSTGAVAAALSMTAGTYLDVSTQPDRPRAAMAAQTRPIRREPTQE